MEKIPNLNVDNDLALGVDVRVDWHDICNSFSWIDIIY